MGKCCMKDCKKKCAIIIGDCKFCEKNYCGKHRLPEDHSCYNLKECKKKHFKRNEQTLMNNKCVASKLDK